MGTVYLVGAGPGDEGLLTLRGKELIEQADCLLYDRLVSAELLAWTKEDCEKIYVGKENRHHAMKQEEMNQLLVEKAKQYNVVVRLKGGDPYVFGRGGEEALYLLQAGVKVEVVPGISSAIAGPAYAGIPVTHRGISGGFHVVTAHDARDELAEIDFSAMAKGRDTCIFLMGLSKVKEIAEKLMAAGMSEDTEVAVISCATTRNQKVCQGNLSDIAQKVEEEKIVSPAIIVIGKNVSLREQLKNCISPQKEKCLVPKIGSQTTKLTQLLRQKDLDVTEVQVGEIVYLETVEFENKKPDWLLFTSRHGVEGFFEQWRKKDRDIRDLCGVKIAVIGDKTGQYVREKGIFPDYISSVATGKVFSAELKEQIKPTDMVWHIKAEQTEDEISSALRCLCDFQEKIVYKNVEIPFTLPENMDEYKYVMFTCASSVDRIMKNGNKNEWFSWLNKNCVCSIGPVCTERLNSYGVKEVVQAQNPNYEELAKCIP